MYIDPCSTKSGGDQMTELREGKAKVIKSEVEFTVVIQQSVIS